MSGIPTAYGGIQFRSRVEARWARMFDLMGWDWDYEPIDLNGYIPDFIVDLHEPLLVEVKSATTIQELQAHEAKLDRSGWDKEILVVGASLPIRQASAYGVTIGWHRDTRWGGVGPGETWWSTASLIKCRGDGGGAHIGLNSDEASYECRVCGLHDGDGHFISLTSVESEYLEQCWNAAGNSVQWRAPRRTHTTRVKGL